MTLPRWAEYGWLRQHKTTRESDAAYLDTCRVKRNTVEYDRIGTTSDTEVVELIAFVKELRAEVDAWLIGNHNDLMG